MRTRRLHACSLVVALALALLVVAPVSAMARPVYADYFCLDAPKDGIFMEMATHPQALHAGGVTYVAYQGPGLDPYAMAYDHADRRWTGPYRVGQNPLVDDFHGAPSLLVDRAGYVHVFYGGHHDPLRHARTKRPRDVSAWVDMADVAPTFTYPQPILMPDGAIEIFYRDGGLDWVSRRSADNGKTWGSAKTVLDTVGARTFYANFSRGVGDEILATFVSIDLDQYFAGSWARRDVHFMRRTADGGWRNAAGSALSMPLQTAAANSLTRVVNGVGKNTNHVVVRAAENGDPCILYSIGSGSGPSAYEYRFLRLENGVWRSTSVGFSDHFFDACSFRFDSTGAVRAYTIEGGSPGVRTGDRTYDNDGGFLVERVSGDGGATWSAPQDLAPGPAGALYNNPSAVQDATSTAAMLVNEWTAAPSIFALRLYLLGEDGEPVGAPFEPTMRRLMSADRIGTAARVSREAFPNGSSVAVVVSQSAFSDALTAAPLAYALGAPVLFTRQSGLSAATDTELRRLRPQRVVIVGGPAVVGAGAVTGIRSALGDAAIERVSGSDRYETAARVAWRLKAARGGRGEKTAFVVRGDDFPDGVSCSAWAAWRGRPILLVKRGWLPPATRDALADLHIADTVVVGDSGVVSGGVAAALPSPERIQGDDRYATSARVASASVADGMLADRLVISTGVAFPDPLTASVLAARLRAPLLLTPPAALHPEGWLLVQSSAGTTARAYVIGGTRAVSSAVADDALRILRR